MQLFQFARRQNFPTIFHINKIPVIVDEIQIIIIYFFLTFALAFIFIIPGYGKRRSIYTVVKAITSVLIGASLMIINYGQEWEVGDVNSIIPYRAGENQQYSAHIGIRIGLRAINITIFEESHGKVPSHLGNSSINYNERFVWTWDQGKLGFGPNAGNLQASMRQAQRRGLPMPMIWILDYFSIDGEGLRYGRFYRMAGWHCHILLWMAFLAWILFNIFSQSIGRYAAYFIGLIGALKILSCIIWISISNSIPHLAIRFPSGTIATSFGSTFWLACVGGFLWIFLASTLIIFDLRYPNIVATFLGIDVLNQYDECVMRTTELDSAKKPKDRVQFIAVGKMNGHVPSKDSGVILLKRRSSIKCAQKKLVHISSMPMQIYSFDDDVVVYANEGMQPRSSTRNNINIKFKPPIPRRNMM